MGRTVVILAFGGVQPLDVSGPASVFAAANEKQPGSYEVLVASPHGGEVQTNAGLTIARTHALASLPGELDTVLVAGGSDEGLFEVILQGTVGRWLAARAPRVRRYGSVCSGAFVVASAGLFDGRRAVTHWASCAWLAQLFPRVRVEPDAIFVVDGPTFSSAGISAGIDLTLALVEADLGHAVASAVARQLVVYLRRPGGQSQFSTALRAQTSAPTFEELAAWVSDHLDRDLRVPALAARAGMSERNFSRVFTRELGQTPADFVERLRVERARSLLERGQLALKEVASRCGFGSVDTLQRAMVRQMRVTPSDYRDRFAPLRLRGQDEPRRPPRGR